MRVRNIPYIISYFLAMLLFVLGALFYRQPLLSVLLLLMLFLPVVSIALTYVAVQQVEFSLRLPHNTYRIPCELPVELTVKNPLPFPLLYCEFSFKGQNLYYPDGDEHELVFPAEAKSTRIYTLPYTVERAGIFTFRAGNVDITDYLHFYTFRKEFHYYGELAVLPKEVELPELVLTKAAIETEESVSSSEGELTRDVLQIREYVPGDRIKDIHWKLTARTGELMVKEYERSRDLYFLLLPELETGRLQDTVAAFCALGEKLLKAKENYRVALYDPADHSFQLMRVDSVEALYMALYRLYYYPVEKKSSAFGELERQYPEIGGVIRIADGRVLQPEIVESY